MVLHCAFCTRIRLFKKRRGTSVGTGLKQAPFLAQCHFEKAHNRGVNEMWVGILARLYNPVGRCPISLTDPLVLS